MDLEQFKQTESVIDLMHAWQWATAQIFAWADPKLVQEWYDGAITAGKTLAHRQAELDKAATDGNLAGRLFTDAHLAECRAFRTVYRGGQN